MRSSVAFHGTVKGRAARLIPLVAILVLALALRLEDISQPLVDYFSWREASTAMMADNLDDNRWNPFWPQVSWTGDQPGYQGREFQTLTIAAAFLDSVFGWRDWHGRFVAALFGVISTFALFRLVSVLHGRRQGLLAGAVYAVLPGAILIDRSYLPDPAMLALALVGLWLLAEGLARRSMAWTIAGWAMGTLAILAKLPVLAAVPAVIYLTLSVTPQDRRRSPAIWLAAALAATCALTAAYYLWAIHLGRTYPPFHVAGHGWLWEEGFAEFWSEGFYLDALRWHAETWLWTPAFIVLAVAGLFATLGRRQLSGDTAERLSAPWFFHIWLLGCALFYAVAALELRGNAWNLHIFNPAIAAFAAAGAAMIANASIPAFTYSRQVIVAAMLLVMLITGRAGIAQIKNDQVGVLDQVLGRHLADVSCEGDLVVASGTFAGSPVAILYSRRKGWLFPPPEHAKDGEYTEYSYESRPALASLDNLVARGADWFGFVKTGYDRSEPSKDFVDHYADVIAHLRARATVAYEDASIAIFDLAPLAKHDARKRCRSQRPIIQVKEPPIQAKEPPVAAHPGVEAATRTLLEVLAADAAKLKGYCRIIVAMNAPGADGMDDDDLEGQLKTLLRSYGPRFEQVLTVAETIDSDSPDGQALERAFDTVDMKCGNV